MQDHKTLFWNRPHPFIFNAQSVAIPGIITFVVILMLGPFGFSELPINTRLLNALASAIIASGCVGIVVMVLKRMAPSWTKNETWTLGKEVLLFLTVVFFIGLAHFVLYMLTTKQNDLWQLFSQVVLRTTAMSLIPILALVLYEQYNHRTLQLKRAIDLTKALKKWHQGSRQTSSSVTIEEHQIWFLHENEKPAYQLNSSAIQFIKAEGNYFEIHVLNNQGSLEKKLVRNALSHAEKALDQEQFWRVHRSYIVNLSQVEMVEGNVRNLELNMKASGEKIPVSRSKATDLLKHFSHLSRNHPIRTK